MAERINIQDAFLNYMRKNRVPVTVFLMNGVKLTGTVSCFDQSAIVIR
ncbi:MAG: RNA chaperone Hfq, partial [Alphaproteobacteria bacterium]|nr:RNA chaperone Hfq [Alphaproteobacteria bacterium]